MTPTITYVGSQDERLGAIQAAYRWAECANSPIGSSSDVIVMPAKGFSRADLESFTPETGIVICRDTRGKVDDLGLATDFVRPLTVILNKPDGHQIVDNIKLLLLIREAFYSDNSECPIITIDPDYKLAINQLYEAVASFRNVIIHIDSPVHGNAVITHLFEEAPDAIQPIILNHDNIRNITSGRFQPYRVLLDPTLLDETIKRLNRIPRQIDRPPLMLVFTDPRMVPNHTNLAFENITFSSLAERPHDTQLLACYASIRASHERGGVNYIGRKALEKINKDDSSVFVPTVIEAVKKNTYKDGILRSVIDNIEHASVREVVEIFEEKILDVMTHRLGNIEAVSAASGMATPTIYRKRSRRGRKHFI